MGTLSFSLFAQPSALAGVASIFDFGDSLNEYNSAVDGQQADALAFSADWTMVGRDIAAAIVQFERENGARTERSPASP